jgi:hypothetical protein
LIQTLSDALLWEPDTISKYYARDDCLLLGIYQKLPTDKSYNKQWKSSYKSMPDFSNWLEYFSKESEASIPLYDIDDNKVGLIREFVQNLTPANGGLMRIKKYSVGLDEFSQVQCFKDGMIFGIQQAEDENGDSFWIQYDTNLRLDFRKIIKYEPPKKEKEALPPAEEDGKEEEEQPEGENDESRAIKEKEKQERERIKEEALAGFKMGGSCATLAYNNGTIISLLPNGYVMQSKNKIQKDLFDNPEKEHPDDVEESRVFTSKSMIRYMANGKIEIMFANGNFSEYDPHTERWTTTNNLGKRRSKGQFGEDEVDEEQINYCTSHLFEADKYTKEETNSRVLFKEDNVISVLYPNGSRYTAHHDGTKIISNHDSTEVIFEKFGYSLVKVLSGRMLDEPEKVKNMEESDAEIAFYDSLQTTRAFLRDRVKDGQIIQTYVHDKTVIQSFVEVNEFADANNELSDGHNLDMEGIDEIKPEGTQEIHGEGEHETMKEGSKMNSNFHNEPEMFYQAIHLIRRQDMSVTKITSDGEICVISGSTRASLNKHGNLMKMGKDYDYLLELFDVRTQERKGGIFTC